MDDGARSARARARTKTARDEDEDGAGRGAEAARDDGAATTTRTTRMDEDGAGGFARRSRNIFADAQRRQWCRERQIGERRGGAASAKTGATALRCSNKRFVEELRLRETLEKHGGCVNCVSWNDDASLLISGSDDMTVCV